MPLTEDLLPAETHLSAQYVNVFLYEERMYQVVLVPHQSAVQSVNMIHIFKFSEISLKAGQACLLIEFTT